MHPQMLVENMAFLIQQPLINTQGPVHIYLFRVKGIIVDKGFSFQTLFFHTAATQISPSFETILVFANIQL